MKIKTHISGLDKMLKGGFIKNRNIILSGSTGLGKTTLGMQYLYNGVTKNKEAGLYITLKENKKDLMRDMKQFGFNIRNLEKNNKIHIIGGKLTNLKSYMNRVNANVDHVIKEIEEVIKRNNIKRVVIDSLNNFVSLRNKEDEREVITKLCHKLSELGCTSILISEPDNLFSKLSQNRIEDFIVDGIIDLHKAKKYGSNHGIHIRKMRGTNHDKEPKLFKITPKGIFVHHKKKYYL